ncbi:MAG TPA: serine hydrolase domain-containing protein [Chitinophagaceae bacterium]|nr:serine hydrolase domain-containing protein [Chitinophagaceae bacterium]
MIQKLLQHCFPVALFLSCTFSLYAQVIQTNTAKQDPMVDYKRLTRVDSVLHEYVNNHWITGAVTIVIKDNQLIQYKGYGVADMETKKPMASNAIFRIMSQTKAIVSVGALMLYEEGKFLLDEPIADFIPEFRHQMVILKYNRSDTTYTTIPAKREITFRDLLTHTSGIGYPDIGNDSMNAIYAKAKIPSGLGFFNADLLQKMKALAKLPLAFQPGTQWMYGLNADLLGCLIEVITGMNLEDYLRKRIFEPLNMKDTYFNLPKDKFSRLASVYTEDASGNIIKWSHSFRNIDPDYPMMTKHYFSGGAGLSSTAFDYAVFLQMLLNGGIYNGHRILSPRTVELMTQNQIGNILFHSTGKFGLGFEITTAEEAAIGPWSKETFSWGGYYGTTYWADPEKNLVCLIMTQQTPNSHGDLTQKFEVAVYQALKK